MAEPPSDRPRFSGFTLSNYEEIARILASQGIGEQTSLRTRLSEEEREISPNVAEQVALRDQEVRARVTEDVARRVMNVFFITNIAVLSFVLLLFIADIALITTGHETPGQRVIDRGVVKVLIGATVVQVGMIMITMARYLFPKPDKPGLFSRVFGRRER